MAKKAPVKKAPAKKTTTAKKSTAGATKPTWKVNAAATKQMTQRTEIFFKFPQGNTTLRVLPPFDGSDTLFHMNLLHYTVKTEDMQRNIAPACLRVHGDGNCYICNFIDWMKSSGDPLMYEIGDDLYPTTNLHVQAVIWDKVSKKWFGPKIVRLPKSVADMMSDMLTVADENDMPYFCDPHSGQAVAVTKEGEGKGTRYRTQATGKFGDLDDEMPGWEANVITDLAAKLDVKTLSIDEQKQALHRTFPDLPWDEIEAAIG